MGHHRVPVNGQPQFLAKQRCELCHYIDLVWGGRLGPQLDNGRVPFPIVFFRVHRLYGPGVAVPRQPAAPFRPAAQGDANGSVVAKPGMVLLLRQLPAVAVRRAVAINRDMIVVVGLAVMPARPVQVDVIDLPFGRPGHYLQFFFGYGNTIFIHVRFSSFHIFGAFRSFRNRRLNYPLTCIVGRPPKNESKIFRNPLFVTHFFIFNCVLNTFCKQDLAKKYVPVIFS